MKSATLSPREALSKAMHWCSKMERSKLDVKRKVLQWGITVEQANEIVETLEKEGFVSTSRFSEAFIKSKLQYNKWGKIKIKYHLLHKGFTEDSINHCFDELISIENYEAMILTELSKKNKLIKDEDPYQRTAKLVAFGQSRGYETDIIFKKIDTLHKLKIEQ